MKIYEQNKCIHARLESISVLPQYIQCVAPMKVKKNAKGDKVKMDIFGAHFGRRGPGPSMGLMGIATL